MNRLTKEREEEIGRRRLQTDGGNERYPDPAIVDLLAEIEALRADNIDLKRLILIAEQKGYLAREKEHTADRNLYYAMKQENQKLREALEKIAYWWKSDARVCYFPVDIAEVLEVKK